MWKKILFSAKMVEIHLKTIGFILKPNLFTLYKICFLAWTSVKWHFKFLCTIIFWPEIRLETVKRAKFNFRHRFWSNIVQNGRNKTHGWFFVRRFGQNSASLEKFRPLLVVVRSKLVAETELRAFDRFR
jgi:hypothetical protein